MKRAAFCWFYCAGFGVAIAGLIGTMGSGTQAQGRSGDRVAQNPNPPMRADGLGPQLVCGTREPDPEKARLVEGYSLRFRGAADAFKGRAIPVYVHVIRSSSGGGVLRDSRSTTRSTSSTAPTRCSAVRTTPTTRVWTPSRPGRTPA